MSIGFTTLPAVLATMSSASRIGTPEESSVPIVRVKRATAILRMTSPMIGAFKSRPWKKRLPLGLRYA